MIFEEIKEKYPYFYKSSAYLEEKGGFFKDVLVQIKELGPDYEFGERVCRNAFLMSGSDWQQYYQNLHRLIVNAFDFLKLQMELEREGHYRFKTYAEVEQYSYNNAAVSGPQYLWELYFSQVFWLVHQKIFGFFKNNFLATGEATGSVLEVPAGTGIYLSEFLLANPTWGGVGLDIADSAVNFSAKVLATNGIPPARFSLLKQDIHTYGPEQKFDHIISGEFLEHLEDPVAVLNKLFYLMKNHGKMFITVAIWAAGIDHIYLYQNAEEVRAHIKAVGFKIEKELTVDVFNTAKNSHGRIPQVFCAIITK